MVYLHSLEGGHVVAFVTVGKREGRSQGEVTRGSGRMEMGAAATGGGCGRSETGVVRVNIR